MKFHVAYSRFRALVEQRRTDGRKWMLDQIKSGMDQLRDAPHEAEEDDFDASVESLQRGLAHTVEGLDRLDTLLLGLELIPGSHQGFVDVTADELQLLIPRQESFQYDMLKQLRDLEWKDIVLRPMSYLYLDEDEGSDELVEAIAKELSWTPSGHHRWHFRDSLDRLVRVTDQHDVILGIPDGCTVYVTGKTAGVDAVLTGVLKRPEIKGVLVQV